MLEFDFSDIVTQRDLHSTLSVFLGVRLFARGILGVSTRSLRTVLPAELEHLLTTEAVWPLVCERLRRLHGLAPFTSEAAANSNQWLVLLLTLDIFRRLQTSLMNIGRTREAATDFYRHLTRKVADLVYVGATPLTTAATDSSPVSPSAACGVYLLPIFLGTCLSACMAYSVTELTWTRIPLQPLKFEQSRQLVISSAVNMPGVIWAFPDISVTRHLLEQLFERQEMQGALMMGGGIPGILKSGAQVWCFSYLLLCLLRAFR